MRSFGWTPVLLLVLGCQSGGAGGGAVTDQDKTAMRDGAAAFAKAVNAKDWPGAAGQYTDDAMMLPANGPALHGKADIQAWMAAYPPFSNFVTTVDEVEGNDDMGYMRGSYEMDITMPGMTGPTHEKGKWIEVLKKQADGSWKVARDIFNSDLPVMAPPAK